MNVPMKNLKLGDRVELFEGAYGTATVIQIEDDKVTFYRPYIHTSDFSYTGGVIPYIGTETCIFLMTPDKTFNLLESGIPLK